MSAKQLSCSWCGAILECKKGLLSLVKQYRWISYGYLDFCCKQHLEKYLKEQNNKEIK